MSAPPSPAVAHFGQISYGERPLTSRKRPKTPHGRPLSPVADTVAEQPFTKPLPQRNASLASSTASPVDSAYSPRRSSSVQSQSFGSLPARRGRSGSVVLQPTQQSSPKKQHRLSRSISATVTPATAEPKEEEPQKRTLQKRPTEPIPAPSYPRSSKPSLRILSTSFVRPHDPRRTSEAHQGQGPGMAGREIPGQTGFSPLATYNHIVETTNKRMATLDYLRKVHEGQVYYFSTISYNPSTLSSLPSLHPNKLGRRATNYLLLGSSLTPVLEFYASNPLDYLRALASLLSEFDAYSQLSSSDSGIASLTRNRMGAMFKSGMSGMRGVKGRRQSTADHSLAEQMSTNGSSTNLSGSGLSSIADSMPLPPVSTFGHDFQYLQLPSLPFDPDFNTSFATLTDILMEAYNGLLQLLPGPEACVPGVAESFAKADKQMRKVMLSGIVNEFGENTRKEVRSEVGGLGKLVLQGLM